MSPEEIRAILDEENIILRPESGNMRIFSKEELQLAIDLNNHHYSYAKIGEQLHCDYSTIKKVFNRNGIIKNNATLKNHNLKYDFFSELNTEEKAYFLGLLFTDGSIRNNNIRLQLKKSDEYMVKRFRDAMSSDVILQEDKRKGKECIGVEIRNPQAVKDLEKYGIIPNKTYSLDNIHIDLIPEKLRPHYIRGLIDGDGSIYFEKVQTGNSIQPVITFTAYSEDCVKSFQNFIDNEVLHIKEHNKIQKYNAYCCKWKGVCKVSKIFHYLYDNATIYLIRKFERAEAFLR